MVLRRSGIYALRYIYYISLGSLDKVFVSVYAITQNDSGDGGGSAAMQVEESPPNIYAL